MKRANHERTWLRFTDEYSEGLWYDKWTKEAVIFSNIPWRLASEPTGEKAENCSGFISESEDSYWAYDVDCYQKQTPVCQNISFTFILRGLCLESIIDTVYILNKTSDGSIVFLGYSGWNIEWHQDSKHWLIANPLYPGKYHTEWNKEVITELLPRNTG